MHVLGEHVVTLGLALLLLSLCRLVCVFVQKIGYSIIHWHNQTVRVNLIYLLNCKYSFSERDDDDDEKITSMKTGIIDQLHSCIAEHAFFLSHLSEMSPINLLIPELFRCTNRQKIRVELCWLSWCCINWRITIHSLVEHKTRTTQAQPI